MRRSIRSDASIIPKEVPRFSIFNLTSIGIHGCGILRNNDQGESAHCVFIIRKSHSRFDMYDNANSPIFCQKFIDLVDNYNSHAVFLDRIYLVYSQRNDVNEGDCVIPCSLFAVHCLNLFENRIFPDGGPSIFPYKAIQSNGGLFGRYV